MTATKAVFPASFKALGDEEGTVEAMVSIFGNVDLQGDIVEQGAFAKSIDRWRAQGDPIPVVVSHDYGDLWQHIGSADPNDVVETDEGLKVRYTVDIKDNPVAAQAYRLMKRRTLKNHSFTYDVLDSEMKSGNRHLKQLEFLEFGPTLIGANPSTDVLAVKSALEDKAEQKTPPWHVEERDGQFCVVADETGETVKCHPDRGAANTHMAALYANVEDASKAGGPGQGTESFHWETAADGSRYVVATALDGTKSPVAFQDPKAGRRISKATRDKLVHLQEHITELLGEDVIEEGKSGDPHPDAPVQDLSPDVPVINEDLLRLRAQIEAL
jgi:HK97 family phage prohead protease